MKKYFGIICAILLAFSLSSCGVKKDLDELELEGRKISVGDAEDMIEDWKKYKEDLQQEESIFEDWYSVEMNSIVKSSYEDGNSEVYMSVSGKVYESYYTFKTKMNLTMKIQGSVYDSENSTDTDFRATIDVIYIDGKAYFDVSMTTKTYGTYETTTAKVNELIVGNLGDIEGFFDIGENESVSVSAISQFMRSLSAILDEDEDFKAYKEDDLYSCEYEYSNDSGYDGRSTSLTQFTMEMDEEYNVKKYETYSSSYSSGEGSTYETESSVSWKKSLGALIIKPLNHKKYIEGDLEDILEDMMGGLY